MGYRYDWNSSLIQRLRAGGLVKELNNNFEKVLNETNKQKLYVYSTHGEHIGALMHALNVFNDQIPPFGSVLMFELHQNIKNEYFIRLFFHNETSIGGGTPFQISLTDCKNLKDCPLKQYFNSSKHLLYDNFERECILESTNGSINSFKFNIYSLFLVIIMIKSIVY